MKKVFKKDKTDKFISYPSDNLYGIIDTLGDAEQALQVLVAAGFNDIQLFYGEEGAHRIDASGAKHGWLAQLRRLHQKTTVEREHAERYEKAVLQGKCVIAVQIRDPDRREKGRLILKEYGGYFINYYGRFGIRQLDL